MGRIKREVALITGAGGRWGREYARALGRAGYRLALCDSGAQVQEAAASLAAAGVETHAEQADISLTDDVRRVVEGAVRAFGRLDVLINCARAQEETRPTDDLDKSLRDYTGVIGTSLKGTFMVGRAVMPHMIARGSGHIINVVSDRAHSPPGHATGAATADLSDAAEWGGIALTLSWSKALREHGIRVNTFCIGEVSDLPAACALALELIGEGATGRTGENIGIWPGFELELAPVPRARRSGSAVST